MCQVNVDGVKIELMRWERMASESSESIVYEDN